jgi:hypothetical protein
VFGGILSFASAEVVTNIQQQHDSEEMLPEAEYSAADEGDLRTPGQGPSFEYDQSMQFGDISADNSPPNFGFLDSPGSSEYGTGMGASFVSDGAASRYRELLGLYGSDDPGVSEDAFEELEMLRAQDPDIARRALGVASDSRFGAGEMAFNSTPVPASVQARWDTYQNTEPGLDTPLFDPITFVATLGTSAAAEGIASVGVVAEEGLAALFGRGAATEAGSIVTEDIVGAGSSYVESTIGSSVRNVTTNVTQSEFQSNLVRNGYQVVKSTVGSNGPVTVLSNGQQAYTIYTATSTGGASAQLVDSVGNTLVKIRLGGP